MLPRDDGLDDVDVVFVIRKGPVGAEHVAAVVFRVGDPGAQGLHIALLALQILGNVKSALQQAGEVGRHVGILFDDRCGVHQEGIAQMAHDELHSRVKDCGLVQGHGVAVAEKSAGHGSLAGVHGDGLVIVLRQLIDRVKPCVGDVDRLVAGIELDADTGRLLQILLDVVEGFAVVFLSQLIGLDADTVAQKTREFIVLGPKAVITHDDAAGDIQVGIGFPEMLLGILVACPVGADAEVFFPGNKVEMGVDNMH